MQRLLLSAFCSVLLMSYGAAAQTGNPFFTATVTGQPSPVQQPQEAGQGTATISGHVYSVAGQPLVRARVVLGGGLSGMLSATTNEQGAYQFQGVGPGRYTLRCMRTGYSPAYYGANNASQMPRSIDVRPRDVLKDIDFILLRGGAISGVVLDEYGEPLARAQVSVVARTFSRGQVQYSPRNSASTDDRGYYRIFDLSPGRYYVRASAVSAGDPTEIFAPVYYPNAPDAQAAQRIDITNGADIAGVDFRLKSATTYTLSGRVLDSETGQVMAGGSIQLMPGNLMEGGFARGGSGIQSDGSFTIRNVVPGHYRLMIISPGNFKRDADGNVVSSTAPRTSLRDFDMPAADVNNYTVATAVPARLRGKVIIEGAERMPTGGNVSVQSRGPSYNAGANATLSAGMTFEVGTIAAGDYDVNVSLTGGRGTYYVREVRVNGQDVIDRGLSIAEGTSPQIEVVVEYTELGSVSVGITDENDQPVSSNFAVISADPARRSSDRHFKSGVSMVDTRFTLYGVIPGDYLLIPWPGSDPNRAMDPDLAPLIEKLGTRIHVEKRSTVSQDLKLTPEIRKLVADQ